MGPEDRVELLITDMAVENNSQRTPRSYSSCSRSGVQLVPTPYGFPAAVMIAWICVINPRWTDNAITPISRPSWRASTPGSPLTGTGRIAADSARASPAPHYTLRSNPVRREVRRTSLDRRAAFAMPVCVRLEASSPLQTNN